MLTSKGELRGHFHLNLLLSVIRLLGGGMELWAAGPAGSGMWRVPFPDQGFHFLFWGQEDAALYRHLGALLRHCLMISADGEDRTEEFHRSLLENWVMVFGRSRSPQADPA